MLLQMYAKQHNDVNLMVDVMKLLKSNDVPLQPGTADIVFRYVNQHHLCFISCEKLEVFSLWILAT
jgi:hypothetical protein